MSKWGLSSSVELYDYLASLASFISLPLVYELSLKSVSTLFQMLQNLFVEINEPKIIPPEGEDLSALNICVIL